MACSGCERRRKLIAEKLRKIRKAAQPDKKPLPEKPKTQLKQAAPSRFL